MPIRPAGIVSASPLAWAHPVVREWFVRKFGTPTEPQADGWPHILAGRSTLISAPTGSGKTLAAFLACIDQLVRQAVAGTLEARTEVLYVSPLKALGNDIQKNLDGPLAEILELAREMGQPMPEIRTAVRTGDTLMPARRAMITRPPHILVTTPESLYILLTAERSRAILKTVRTVIVDEIHAVADDKRGSHLSLSLERLEALADGPVTRIGLSATQKPIELVGQFLAGAGRPAPVIVQITPRRTLDLAVEVPAAELGPIATNELWNDIYDRLAALTNEHRSTLIFVNTRRLAERVTHHLAERLGADAVAAHHGSLSRKIRLEAERRLKGGELKALVATASLELGIDIGTVDLVCQIGSPRAIAVAVQRIGRAGHWRGAVPKGRLFATTRDDLVECAALVLAIRRGDLDRLVIPDAPLDILAQQIVAICAAEEWTEDELFALVRRAMPYRELPREAFDEVLEMLAQGIAAKRGRYGAYLYRDRVNGRVKGRRNARLTAITSGGAIPETGLYQVVAEPEGTVIGTVDEDFAVESMAGDVMLLGNTSWRIRRVSSAGRVIVEDAHGASPTIPFWNGEAPGRTPELSSHVGEVRETVSRLRGSPVLPTAAVAWLMTECGLDTAGAEQLVAYIELGRAVLGVVPTIDTIVAERFFDEGGGMQLVIHAPFGARINKAWGLALRKRFCRSFNFELQAAATDNGINIALAEQHSFPLADVFNYLHTNTLRDVLEQAVLDSPIFGSRWRWDAGRALALVRFQGGKKVPIQILRMRSDDLLASVFPDVAACQENIEGDIKIPNHPLVREVMKDVLTEALDLDGLMSVLSHIADGSIRCVSVDTPVASAFSHELLNANPYAFLDDAPLEERRARAVELRRMLPESVLSDVGRLDPEAIAEVCRDAWPDVRDADDLHDSLQTLVALPAPVDAQWQSLLDQLAGARRAGRAGRGDRVYWVATERVRTFVAAFPDATFDEDLPAIDTSTPTEDEALVALVQGWLMHIGPTTASELSSRLGLRIADVDGAFLRLEAAGTILRGHFRNSAADELEWCERRLLARIHRLTLGRLRREIAPVTSAEYMRWLLRWQHVAPGTQVVGERGTLEVLGQLQGFESPANAWEPQLLARRINKYDPDALDRLCLTGAVGWGRVSPHPAFAQQEHHAQRRDAAGLSLLIARGAPPPRARAAALQDSLSSRGLSIDPLVGLRPSSSVAQARAVKSRRVVPTSVAPVTFFVRDDAEWMTPRQPSGTDEQTRGLSRHAGDVLQLLQRSGASFFADVVRGTSHLKSEVEAALWELVAAGLVTADGFDNLRALIDPRRRSGHGSGRHARPRHSTGRWSLLYPAVASDRARTIEATCWMLLKRYGVVFRELLSRETNLPPWRELLQTFRRLEDRGEVRGGRFVNGFIGEQFALPVAVESLRALRHSPPKGEIVTISAADPLNLVGILVPGERVPSVSGRFVSFRDGVAEPVAHSPVHPINQSAISAAAV